MTIDGLSDSAVRDIFESVRNIAVVGVSANTAKPSNYVPVFLKQHGYRVFPVNPGLAGQEAVGETVYGTLADIPETVDMVDIFRASEHIPGVVDEILAMPNKPKVVWMQMGIINEEAAEKARAAGIEVVMDRCPKQEIPRLQPTTPK
jgi:predicted CoA-binding protein